MHWKCYTKVLPISGSVLVAVELMLVLCPSDCSSTALAKMYNESQHYYNNKYTLGMLHEHATMTAMNHNNNNK